MLGIKQDETLGYGEAGWIGPAPYIKGTLPGIQARSIIERDHKFTSPSYTRDYPLVVKRAQGSVVEDVDGNRLLDFTAGIAVCATGHCHPSVVGAIEQQSRALIHMCGADFYYPPLVELVERLVKLPLGNQEWRTFLTNSGTEATEAAMKLTRHQTKRKWFIAFYGAFHGRTMGSLSLTASKTRQQVGFGPLVPMVAHAPFGDCDFIEDVLFKTQVNPAEVAAVFVEPIQGEGGYIFPDDSFLPRLRKLCDDHGILLVCDEIQSGMGRTGKWFAFEHYGIIPDVILMAKGIASGLPLGAVLARADIMNWPPGTHASTFGGNPVACAAAIATIDLVESTYMANAAKAGELLHERLCEVVKKHKVLANPRGMGLMRAVDVVSSRSPKTAANIRKRILTEAFQRGLILLGCGELGIRFTPPLCINEAQIDVGVRVFGEAVSTVL